MSPNPRDVAPSPSGTPNAVKVEPPPLYYLVIDGGNEADSAWFGAELEKRFGWKNLVGDFMPHPSDGRALHDPAHPFLLLRKYNNPLGGQQIIVVTPNGENAFGRDTQWAHYSNEKPAVADSPYKTGPQGKFTRKTSKGEKIIYGRHTAAEHSFQLVKSLFLRPNTRRLTLDKGTEVQSIVEYDGGDPFKINRKASIVQVSSHGFLGGMMAGDALLPSTVATPEAARTSYGDYWLVLGKICHLTFRGPLWIILAQCSTTNSACWTMWARMMAGSDPVVRGILAYEESAPVADTARDIVKRFMDRLARGETFLAAWKGANGHGQSWGQPWAAIVHRDAVSDTMKEFRTLKPLVAHPPNTPGVVPSYRGYLSSLPDGEDIVEHEPPFSFSLWYLPDTPAAGPPPPRVRVEAATLGEKAAELALGARWQMVIRREVHASGSNTAEPIKKALLKLIHIRPTYPNRVNYQPLFKVTATVSPADPAKPVRTQIRENLLTVNAPEGTTLLTVDLACVADPWNCPPVQPAHTYLWWRVTLETQSGTYTHDFRTEGLSY
jgi:hypothetical protein